MNQAIDYKRAVARVLFVVLLLLIMAAPQLLSDEPSTLITRTRNMVGSIPLIVWVLVGLGALIVLGIIRAQKTVRSSVLQQGRVTPGLPIIDAVTGENGGNGLVSRAFPLELPWLGLAGWVSVQDADKECLVIDGRKVIKETRLFFAPARLIGKPIFARRVLLNPAPLTDITGEALTKDQFGLTLGISVSYKIVNPVHVAALEDPLTELKDLVVGVITNYIPTEMLDAIVHDDGTLKFEIEKRLEASPSLQGNYSIVSVLKAEPSGDERVIEIIRQIQEETKKQELTEKKGITERIKAQTDLEIVTGQKELDDKFAALEHERAMEKQVAIHKAEILKELVEMIGDVAKSGIDPSGVIEEIRDILSSPEFATGTESPRPALIAESQIATEQQMLERYRIALGISDYDMKPHPTKPGELDQALITFADFTLIIKCPDDYPEQPPDVRVQTSAGDEFSLEVPWHADSRLAEVAVTAKMQVPFELEKRAK